MTQKGWAKCYREVLLLVRDLYQKASLVHGDLSEYNILFHNAQPYLIDVGQSVHIGTSTYPPTHPPITSFQPPRLSSTQPTHPPTHPLKTYRPSECRHVFDGRFDPCPRVF